MEQSSLEAARRYFTKLTSKFLREPGVAAAIKAKSIVRMGVRVAKRKGSDGTFSRIVVANSRAQRVIEPDSALAIHCYARNMDARTRA